eukprot:TRINITY_DN8509_c0_g4_i1.p1 TRINITY_DN8509_c0_g4~~TRINITY_DN8509_c0_g4_i1.p1  ORF type:complete len:1229 (+),score=336.65 TRINITY_DN8509_c0_g4_i1:129-3689(+)
MPGSGSRSGSRSGSISSKLSSLSRRGLSFSFRPTNRSSMRSEDETFEPGNQCETVSLVTMRKEEALESDVVLELPIGTTCEIVQAGATAGWISSRTKMNEALIVKRRLEVQFAIDDFEVGGQHEVKSMVTVRAAETLDSEIKTELKPGTLVKILELGTVNKRRAKISTDTIEGWISMATKQGELLIGKVTDTKGDRGGLFGASSSKIKQILEASRSGELDTISKIVEGRVSMMSRFQSRPNLNCSDIRGKTPLIYAAAFGNKQVVEYLLSKSEVEVNAMDDTQKSAMHHASKRARKCRDGSDMVQAEIVAMLIKSKSYLEARDHNGCTALMFAVANGDDAVTNTLLAANANVNVKDFEGHTPLDYATNFGHTDLVQVLRTHGARGEDSDDEPQTIVDAVVVGSVMSPASESVSTAAPSEVQSASASVSTGATSPKAKRSAAKRKSKTTLEGDEGVETAPADAGATASASVATASGSVATAKKASGKKAAAKKGGAKSKAKAKDKTLASGMQEVMDTQAAATTEKETVIAVEEVKEEVVDEAEIARERAKQKLQAVLAGQPSIKELQQAIEDATAATVPEEDVAPAQTVLQELRLRAAARDELLNAVELLDVAGLKKAIADAEKAGVPAEEVAKAKTALAVEEPKALARTKLKQAQASGDINALKAALEEADAAKVPAGELQVFRDLLAGAENREEAQRLLNEAVENRDVNSLKFAIQQAKDAGLDTASAEAVLKEEEPKAKAREQLASAAEECTINGLTAAIEVAKSANLPAEEYAECEQLLAAEIEKERLVAGIKKVMDELKEVDTKSIDALTGAKAQLTEAIEEAKAAGVAEVHLGDAELRRRKIHNGIEDLKGSIRVFCRVRPISKREIDLGDNEITKALDAMTIQVEESKFGFDAVFMPGTQEEVFNDCRDLVQSAVDGYNVTIFAYGQTGAGKTHTMYGAPGMEGVAPRTIHEIFNVTKKGEARYTYTIMGSMLELYRNELIDLLVKGTNQQSKGKLNIRSDKGAVSIEHLAEEECDTPEQLNKLLERGNNQRTVASTAMNSQSSRSHLILIIRIISVNIETKDQLRGKILICDLAGSERLKKSQVTNDMQKEAIEINKSLTALGDVIEALTKAQKQIPYRNHKLTQLMQDSLGGSAKTLMFVNCSPAASNLDETTMSLKYATRAKQIKNTHKKAKPVEQE